MSDINGQTKSEFEKSGHTVASDGKTIVTPWGHDSGRIYNPNSGKAESK